MSEIGERCLAMIAKQKSIPVQSIELHQSLEDLNFDSLDKVTLVFDVEEEFHITINDEELASLQSVGDIVQGVEQKIAASAGTS